MIFFNMSLYVVENHLYKKWVFWEAHKKPDRLFQAHAKLALINSIEYNYERAITSHRLEINTFVLRCKTHKKGLKIPELVSYLWTCQLNVYSREPCLEIDFNANVRQLNTNTPILTARALIFHAVLIIECASKKCFFGKLISNWK